MSIAGLSYRRYVLKVGFYSFSGSSVDFHAILTRGFHPILTRVSGA